MAGREMTQEEHIADLRATLTNAATITEAFMALFEDGVTPNTDNALAMLEELLGCIKSVYVDLEPVEEVSKEIDVITMSRPVRLKDGSADDMV